MSYFFSSRALLVPFIVLAIALTCRCENSKGKITEAFTDPLTGISFQRFFGAKSGFGFGIALPETPNNSFIGQLSFPLQNGAGWGGWSLTGDMKGPLLMATWSDGTNVVSSFRQAFNEDDNPPEVTGTFTVRPIAQGTSTNSSSLTYTFLCEGCLSANFGLGAADTAGTVEMGWALSSKPVQNPGSSAGILAFHDIGFGGFSAQLGKAKNAEFDRTWVALAGAPLAPVTGAQPFNTDGGAGGGGGEEDNVENDGGNDSGDDD